MKLPCRSCKIAAGDSATRISLWTLIPKQTRTSKICRTHYHPSSASQPNSQIPALTPNENTHTQTHLHTYTHTHTGKHTHWPTHTQTTAHTIKRQTSNAQLSITVWQHHIMAASLCWIYQWISINYCLRNSVVRESKNSCDQVGA